MSSLSVVGFFSLRGGHVPPPPASAARKSTTYAFYTSHLICLDGSHSAVEVRSFLPTRESPLPDHTVAFIHGNLFIPESKECKLLLDTVHIAPVPGDTGNREQYNTHLPNFRSPLIIAVGHVTTDVMKTPVPHSVRVLASSYVRGSAQTTIFSCIFTNQARWAKIPILNIQSCVYVAGLCHSIKNRHLSISVDSLATSLSASTSPDAFGSSSAIGSTDITSLFDPLGPSDDDIVITSRRPSPVAGPSTFIGAYNVIEDSPPPDDVSVSPKTKRARIIKNKPTTPKPVASKKPATHTPKTPRARAKAAVRIISPAASIVDDLAILADADTSIESVVPTDQPSNADLPSSAKKPRRK